MGERDEIQTALRRLMPLISALDWLADRLNWPSLTIEVVQLKLTACQLENEIRRMDRRQLH